MVSEVGQVLGGASEPNSMAVKLMPNSMAVKLMSKLFEGTLQGCVKEKTFPAVSQVLNRITISY